MKKYILLIFLCSCHSGKIYYGLNKEQLFTGANVESNLKEIADEFNSQCGQNILAARGNFFIINSFDENANIVTVKTEIVASTNAVRYLASISEEWKDNSYPSGFYTNNTKTAYILEKTEFRNAFSHVNYEYNTLIVHEFGHSLGLEHIDNSVMTTEVFVANTKQSVENLIGLLNERKLILCKHGE